MSNTEQEPTNWAAVEEIQSASFHVQRRSMQDLALCMAVYEEDPERYRQDAQRIKELYQKSLSSGQVVREVTTGDGDDA